MKGSPEGFLLSRTENAARHDSGAVPSTQSNSCANYDAKLDKIP